jgi:CNT family concentrative nucleoside transporter
MQWVIKRFAWFFFTVMNVSGAEAVVATASPFVGQGESAILVRPYVDIMTDSEIHLIMTSGFSTIAGSVLALYASVGIPVQHMVTASIMSIPASMAISKLRYPETDEPVTRGRVVVDRGVEDRGGKPANALHAFSNGAMFGLVVAGLVLANVLTIISLLYMVNGLLTWIGRGFGINSLTLQLILGYVFYPITFLMGVPRNDILQVAQFLGTKLIANEFVAYLALTEGQHGPHPVSDRSFLISSYALCGFANLGSLGIGIGVLTALGPSRAKVITRVGPSALICGFLSTMQAACIA